MATQLPSGKWRTQVCVDWRKRKYKYFIGQTAREADMLAEQWKLSTRPHAAKGSFMQASREFLSTMDGILSPSTLRSYKSVSDNLPPRFSSLPLSEITSGDLYAAYKRLRTPKTVRNCHGYVSSVFSFKNVPMPPVTLPEKVRRDCYIPNEEVVQNVLRLAAGTKLEVPVELGIRGLRRGEVCAVESSDLDGNVLHIKKSIVYGGNGLVVKPPKTFASDRYVELPPRIAEMIREAGRATSYTPDSLTCAFKKFLKRNGLPVFRFHDLRHAFVSIAHANGIPDSYIMSMGGWSTPYTMQNVYRHSLDSSLEKYQKKMEAILSRDAVVMRSPENSLQSTENTFHKNG